MSEARMRVEGYIREMCDAAIARLYDPKNVAKGDTWLEESFLQLANHRDEERQEFYLGCAFDEPDVLDEAGDEIVFMAFEYDKAVEEGRVTRKEEAQKQ